MGLERLVIVRHGESVGNEAASAAERGGEEVIALPFRDADTPLSDTGEAQARAVGSALDAIGVTGDAVVWASTYRRAARTGELALAAAGLGAPLRLDERLRDRELGVLDHLTSHGVNARYPSEAERRAHLGKFFYRPPGGESWADVALRLRSFLADATAAPAATGVVFVHEAVVHLIRYVLEGWDERRVLDAAVDAPAPNASVTLLEAGAAPGDPWRAALVGDVAHLERHGVPATMHAGRHDVEPRSGDIDPGRPDDAEEESHAAAD
ncbi:histidine phosphatase family protein [Microbacterium marinilacus]|uniref:phosphoglycerate mutase (2,3-diphosphoglycerate-dependent) n=1 Tax=Microbacterium marinilacus TaxID=415209 RepID=A0ABP7BIA8_9MICO|nr:histidine phosphatase family protein [Microbacterium marinilacus]MBY0687704.1 histidine phosphatase family protein [Microbacterium marinilacus]